MGWRRDRAAMSAASGGGSTASIRSATSSGSKNKAPVTDGIQASLTPHCCITWRPAALVQPLAKIRLRLRPSAMNSVTRRPSRKEKISPHTMPSGRPLRNRNATFQGAGVRANSSSAASATPIKPSTMATRRPGVASETNLMPRNFETV